MRRLAPALLVLVLLTGCERAEVVQLDGRYVQVRIRDYRYDRQHIRVKPGRILFGVANDGPDPTNFRIRRGGEDVLDITTMQPGERESAYATLAPGRYVMYSSVGRNETLGEHGTLVVSRKRLAPPEPEPDEPRGLVRP